MENRKSDEGERLLDRHEGIAPSGRVVDPSEAVHGMGFLFGAIGALAGIVVAIFVNGGFSAALVLYCLLAALACGSAGIVTGGLVGALFAVMRGRTPRPRETPKPAAAHGPTDHVRTGAGG